MIVEDLAGTPDAWTFNRLPAALAELDVPARHVIHVGAHLGEEVPAYRAAGFEGITLVEPDPDTCVQLRAAYPDLVVLRLACGMGWGLASLRRSKYSIFNSLQQPRKQVGEVFVQIRPLAAVQGDANVAVIDTQGTELDVLRSADLSTLDLVVVETQGNDLPVRGAPPSAASWSAVAGYMEERGWVPRVQWRHEDQDGRYATYCDTLFTPGG